MISSVNTECRYSFCPYPPKVDYVSGTVLGDRGAAVMNETDTVPAFWSLESSRYKYIDNRMGELNFLLSRVTGSLLVHAVFLSVTASETLIWFPFSQSLERDVKVRVRCITTHNI